MSGRISAWRLTERAQSMGTFAPPSHPCSRNGSSSVRPCPRPGNLELGAGRWIHLQSTLHQRRNVPCAIVEGNTPLFHLPIILAPISSGVAPVIPAAVLAVKSSNSGTSCFSLRKARNEPSLAQLGRPKPKNLSPQSPVRILPADTTACPGSGSRKPSMAGCETPSRYPDGARSLRVSV
jgi:hypothetical protein